MKNLYPIQFGGPRHGGGIRRLKTLLTEIETGKGYHLPTEKRCWLTTNGPTNESHLNPSSSSSKNVLKGTIPPNGFGISIGQYAEMERTFTPREVEQFGTLIGDLNPIHLVGETVQDGTESDFNEEEYHTSKIIVHGMLTASLFSSIFGTLIPGSMYRSQSLQFRDPVYCNQTIIGRVCVTNIRDLRRGLLVTCDTQVLGSIHGTDTIVEHVTGDAEVWLPGVPKKEFEIEES